MTTDLAVQPDILQCIGNTTLLALRNVVPRNGARIVLKLENENPTGSMKDRMALAMIEAAAADGRLTPGKPVVEYTGGSTGVSLSLVCAVRGYPLDIVSSDAFAPEKLDHMRLLGARVTIVPSDGGRITADLLKAMIERARTIGAETGAFWTNQLSNGDQVPAYHKLGHEAWSQSGGRIDAFVQSVGTSASLQGTAHALRQHQARVMVVAVEPAESAVLSGGQTGAHRIEGIGAGFVVPLWRPEVPDRIERVSTEDAMAMTRRLAREEGLCAGTSTGCNVVAALRVAEQLPPDSTVLTIMVDTGMKYLKTYALA
ncbi:MAG TPA: cysteine synthase family protein [Gemmatimonadales bacterium]|nr:cysteine synthase family protein [Gemmatimonadales bacterium]